MNYTQSPSYQRLMQKLQTIRPEQRAVLNTLSMDAEFADDMTRKTLAAIAQRNNTEYRDKSYDLNRDYANRSLDLREKALASGSRQANSNIGLRRRMFENEQDKNRITTGLGIGQVFAEADYGRQRDALDLETFKEKRKLSNRLNQLYGGE